MELLLMVETNTKHWLISKDWALLENIWEKVEIRQMAWVLGSVELATSCGY